MINHLLSSKRTLEMKYAGGTVKHLGLQMYSGPVPAIAELIANAWDACATNVTISIPFAQEIDTSSEIRFHDNGKGMSWNDFNNKYMVVGRDARKEEGDDVTNKDGCKRKIMARKGLGKLAGFGIADIVEISSIQNKKKTSFVMDYNAIKELKIGDSYKIIPNEDDIRTNEENGTTIVLKKLKLKQKIHQENFMLSMIRRFSILSNTFKVKINNEYLLKNLIPFQIYFPNKNYKVSQERIVKKQGIYKILGAGLIKYWIGFTKTPIQDAESRGVTVIARGKLVQEPWFFDVAGGITGQHGMQYMTGEVEADFLDDETDFVTTGRGSVMWAMPIPELLKKWGHGKIKSVLNDWALERGKSNIKNVKKIIPHLNRIEHLPKRQKTEIQNAIYKIASIPTIEEKKLGELVQSLINVYENKQLSYMIDEISSLTLDAQAKLYDILQEFSVLESVSIAQIVKSRLKIIEKFEEMIDSGVKEKPDMQDFLRDYPWLIDHTYSGLVHEKRLDTILKNKFSHRTIVKGKSERVDFFCLGELGRAFVIEVKRPQKTVGLTDMIQLGKYVDFLRREDKAITVQKNKRTIFGYLIGSKYSEDTDGERDRLETNGIYVQTWDILLRTAYKSHEMYFKAIKNRIPANDPRLANF